MGILERAGLRKSEVQKAVEAGRAMWLPQFAVHEGGPALSKLEEDIRSMSHEDKQEILPVLAEIVARAHGNARKGEHSLSAGFIARHSLLIVGLGVAIGCIVPSSVVNKVLMSLLGGTAGYILTAAADDAMRWKRAESQERLLNALDLLVAAAATNETKR